MSMDSKEMQKLLMPNNNQRDRSKNKAGALHKVNPPGTKLLKQFKKRTWCGRAKGPFA
jgi:hypothetical protein